MRRRVLVVLVGVLCLGACGGDGDDAAGTSVASPTARRGEPIVIRGKLIVAAEEGSEPIATGTILEGSTLGGSAFCAGGTIRDSHASLDPKMKAYLIDRKITCPDGTVRIGYHAGGQRRAAGSDPDRLVDDRERDRSIRTGRRKREKRGRVRPQPRFANTGDAERDRHALKSTHGRVRQCSGMFPESAGFRGTPQRRLTRTVTRWQ